MTQSKKITNKTTISMEKTLTKFIDEMINQPHTQMAFEINIWIEKNKYKVSFILTEEFIDVYQENEFVISHIIETFIFMVSQVFPPKKSMKIKN